MIGAPVTLWTHALAALLFGTLALSQRHGGAALPRMPFVVALFATALWALAVAGLGRDDVAAHVSEAARNLAWLGFMYALAGRDRADPAWPSLPVVYAATAMVVAITAALAIAAAMVNDAAAEAALKATGVLLHLLATTAALILVYRLRAGALWRMRAGVRILVVALAIMWSVDFVLYGTAWFSPAHADGLVDMRGAVMVVLAPLLALAVQKGEERALQMSRTVALLLLAGVAISLYVGVTAFATGIVAAVGGSYARLVQTALIFGTTTALLTLVSTPWTRAWAKVVIAKHLFSHRYDYRSEWLRFTETLGAPNIAGATLEMRVVKAMADLTGSPGGMLLVADGAALDTGAAWNWPEAPAADSLDTALFAHLSQSGRIVELDAVRANATIADADRGSVAPWLRDSADAWAVVPLLHFDRLAGAIVLSRPLVDRALDWEDFDLLGVAGRQAASYLAEARAHAALADAQRFDEFNRRFAFIMHDLKNLVSQLSLVARNAQRHADNPEFRADMVATLTDSSNRMNALLARLSQHHGSRGEAVRPVPLLTLAERVAAGRRAQHAVVASGDPGVIALADPAALDTLLSHLVQNAIEASAHTAQVLLTVAAEGGEAVIRVSDTGRGMSAAFVRDQLFRPFVSGKPGGFGLGAFEARQLAEGMGGAVTVTSREGEGTCFRVVLPRAGDVEMAA